MSVECLVKDGVHDGCACEFNGTGGGTCRGIGVCTAGIRTQGWKTQYIATLSCHSPVGDCAVVTLLCQSPMGDTCMHDSDAVGPRTPMHGTNLHVLCRFHLHCPRRYLHLHPRRLGVATTCAHASLQCRLVCESASPLSTEPLSSTLSLPTFAAPLAASS